MLNLSNVRTAVNHNIYFAKSTDEGATFQSERRINDVVEMEETFTHFAYNKSIGLSVVYSDHQYGQSYDMYFSWSIDDFVDLIWYLD